MKARRAHRRTRAEIEREARALAVALERGGEAIVTVAAGSRILDARPEAADVMANWFAEHSETADLPDAVARWRAQVREQSTPEPFVLLRHGNRLTVRIVPGAEEDLLLFSERTPTIPDAALLARRLPISRREAEVLARLAGGEQNATIGHGLAISPFTVARHLEKVYQKLGVHSRVEATAAALAAAAD